MSAVEQYREQLRDIYDFMDDKMEALRNTVRRELRLKMDKLENILLKKDIEIEALERENARLKRALNIEETNEENSSEDNEEYYN